MIYDIWYFDELESTNDYAWKHVQHFNPEIITVIQAGFQTRGRGQGDHQWFSEKDKNLLFTICIPLNGEIKFPIFSLHHMISLSVWEYVTQVTSANDVRIKWPNDILVGNKKISGILVENLYTGRVLKWVFIGVGININQLVFPPEIVQKATSIYLITGKARDIRKETTAFMTFFSKYFQKWAQRKFIELRENYVDMLWKKNQWIDLLIKEKKEIFRAKFEDVSQEGQIVVSDQWGFVRLFYHHEIEWIF
ncbi:MAG: biotin--[acetyl-CoA-carboxylase] ligase [Bacteroidales bacterium]|nr:biotin--[acetyl-CoA-carboxylase] ligase [Bacteroidales bacterium]